MNLSPRFSEVIEASTTRKGKEYGSRLDHLARVMFSAAMLETRLEERKDPTGAVIAKGIVLRLERLAEDLGLEPKDFEPLFAAASSDLEDFMKRERS